MERIDLAALPAVPWKNGGGLTRELACHPPGAAFDAFAWRISLAEVAASGPFSRFSGIDRIIALLDGGGMRLRFEDGRLHDLTAPLTPFRFRGEDALHAELAGGPSRDLNLMLRRGAAQGRMDVWRSAGEVSCEPGYLLLFCASGRWQAEVPGGGAHTLAANQILRGDCAGVALQPLQPDSALLALHVTLQPS